MKSSRATILCVALMLVLFSGIITRAVSQEAPASKATSAQDARKARGAYLVSIMGCNDCHTPLKIGPRGPEPDMSRALSGHPAELTMPPGPSLAPGPWLWTGAATMTAFSGPWGVSFTANLTPDKDTGLGTWTEDMFIATMKTARHQGKGRPILPPMPVPALAALSDQDIKDLFFYLQSLPPVSNKVPAPIDPPEGK